MDKDVKIKIKIDSETAKLDTLNSKVDTVKSSFDKANSATSSFSSRLDALNGKIKTAFNSSEIDNLVKKTLNPYGAELDKINQKWGKHLLIMQKNGKDTSGVFAAWNKEISNLETSKFDTLNSKVNTVASSFDKSSSLVSSYTNRILALGGAYLTLDAAINAGKMLISQADSMKLLDARLKLATSSTAEYESQQKELLKTSLDTYTPLSNITTLFTRLNPALTKVGGNTLQVNQVVSSFTKGLQLGGSTVEETNSAILQFSQSMGSGALRGEEFNAMADASPKLLEYIAKGLGVASTELRNMAENGELTSLKVSNALLKVKSDIDRDFATLPLTVSKAVTNAGTELAIGIRDIDSAIGITDTLAKSIERTTLNIGSYTQSVIGYYQEVKKFFDDNKMITETMSKAFDFLGRAGNTSLTIATLDTINSSFKSTKLGADEIIKKIDELEQRKATLAQNKWTDQNTQAINAQITDLRSQLGLLNKDMLFTSKDVIPQNKTAIDDLIGGYDGYIKKVELINTTLVRNETEVTKLLGDERQKSLQQIEDNIKKAKLQGATEKEINDYRIRELQKLDEKQNKATADLKKSLDDRTNQYSNYYATIGDFSNLWILEEQKIRKENTALTKVELDKLINIKKKAFDKEHAIQKEYLSGDEWKSYYEKIGDYENSWLIEQGEIYAKYEDSLGEKFPQYLAIAKKEYFDKFKNENRLLLEDSRNIFDDMSSSLKESFETNFFDLIMGDFDDFKSYLKSFGNDIFRTIASPFATSLSKTAATTLAGLIGLSDNGFADQLKSAGLSLVNGQWVGGSDTNGEPNIVVSSSGDILKGESLLSSMPTALNAISAIKTGYGIFQAGGIGSYLSGSLGFGGGVTLGPLGGLAGSAYGAGYTTIGNLLAGGNTVLTGGTLSGASGGILAGGLATAGLLGGVGGYALGSIGDKLLGANTYAGTTGAAGGAIGAMVGSIVPGVGTLIGGLVGAGLGSVIGGIFGKKSLKEMGIYANTTIDANTISNKTLQSYEKWVKKSWFSSSTSWIYKDLTLTQLNQITALFNTVDKVASIVGSSNLLSIAEGKYSGTTMSDTLLPKYLIGSALGYNYDTLDNNTFKTNTSSKQSKWQWALDATKTTNSYEEYLASWKDTNAEHNAMVEQINYYFDDWKDIAKEMDTTIIELISSSIGAFQTTIREYSLYNTSDNLEKLKLQMQFKNEDLAQTIGTVGLNAAELTVENFSEAYKKAISKDFSKATFDTWENLADVLMNADEAAKSYAEAVKQIETSMLSVTRTISLYNADDTTKAALNLEYANSDLNTLMQTMGVAGVNLENFNDKFNLAMAEGLSQEKLDNWTNLGNLLINVADATNNYNNILNQTLIATTLNISTFLNSFKTNENLLVDSASFLGIKVASTYYELAEQFKALSEDGLLDSELDYLNKAKDLIETKNTEILNSQKTALETQLDAYNQQISTISSSISTVENIIQSLDSTIDKLKGTVNGSSYTLEQFYANMKETQALALTKDYESFQVSLEKTIGYSDALYKNENFKSLWDMQFAQVVATNQFEGMDLVMESELDYLKKIEENTKNTANKISLQIENLGNKLTDSSIFTKELEKYEEKQSVYDIYTKYNLHQFQNDDTGYTYWENLLKNGMSENEIEERIKLAAKNLLLNTDTAAAKTWLQTYNSFDVGTAFVPQDQLAKIHRGEIITPPPLSADIRAGNLTLGNNNKLLEENIKLREEIKDMKDELKKMAKSLESIDDREDYKLKVGA